jgi:AraC-like DNA-binding protein
VGQLPVRLPALGDDRLRAIAAFLRANPADDRTLAAFGAAVGASERTLSRLFRQEAGMSFPQWAHPVPPATRAGPARDRHVGHQHGAGLRLAEPERVHRDLSARIRQHTREVLLVLSSGGATWPWSGCDPARRTRQRDAYSAQTALYAESLMIPPRLVWKMRPWG